MTIALFLLACNRPYGNLNHCEPDTAWAELRVEAWKPDECPPERWDEDHPEDWWPDVHIYEVDVCVWRDQLERSPCNGTPIYAYDRLYRMCTIYWDSCSAELPSDNYLRPCDFEDARCCQPELYKPECADSSWDDGVEIVDED